MRLEDGEQLGPKSRLVRELRFDDTYPLAARQLGDKRQYIPGALPVLRRNPSLPPLLKR